MSDGELVDLGDVTLFVRQLGVRRDGPALVVIHGGPDWDHSYLLPGLEPLAADHHVVLFDMRGCGRSSRDLPSEAYQPEHVVDDVDRLIRRLGLGPVDLLGFSTGGRVAMHFLGKHPEQVRRLVLASTTAYSDFEQYLEGWDEYQERARQQADEAKIDSDTYEAWARNAATTAIWDLQLMPAYLQLLDRVRFTGTWGAAHPTIPRRCIPGARTTPYRSCRRPGSRCSSCTARRTWASLFR